MKTIQQRLQSRISKRRNAIRKVESDVSLLVSEGRAMRALDYDRDDYGYIGVVESIREGKHLIRHLADDQKLDKRIKNVITQINCERQHFYELPELV